MLAVTSIYQSTIIVIIVYQKKYYLKDLFFWHSHSSLKPIIPFYYDVIIGHIHKVTGNVWLLK